MSDSPVVAPNPIETGKHLLSRSDDAGEDKGEDGDATLPASVVQLQGSGGHRLAFCRTRRRHPRSLARSPGRSARQDTGRGGRGRGTLPVERLRARDH